MCPLLTSQFANYIITQDSVAPISTILMVRHLKEKSSVLSYDLIKLLFRLKLDEVKNPLLLGGLNLPCVISKADALFLSQTCRMVVDSTNKEYSHIKYWMGLYIREYSLTWAEVLMLSL